METIFEESPTHDSSLPFSINLAVSSLKITTPKKNGKRLKNSKRFSILQNSPNKIKDKKTFHLSSTLSAEKYHSNPNKILRHSESFCYRKEGIHLEKSIKKLTLSDRETTLFCPGEVSPKIESTSFNTPIKQNKQTFNERLMESDKHPSSNYLILNIDKKEDEISVLFEKELKIINHFIEYFNERNQELLKFFETDGVIEIMGQNRFPLILTLQALANNYKILDLSDGLENFSVNSCEECVNKVILNFQGKATNFNQEVCKFYFSAKVLRKKSEVSIDQIRIKFV